MDLDKIMQRIQAGEYRLGQVFTSKEGYQFVIRRDHHLIVRVNGAERDAGELTSRTRLTARDLIRP